MSNRPFDPTKTSKEQVKKVLEKHLTPLFNGSSVQLVVQDSETYEKMVEDLSELMENG